jgi:parallel beta-helix repeat protein
MRTITISELDSLTSIANDDLFTVVDVSDTSQSGNGSTRKLPFSSLSTVSYFLRPTGLADSIIIQAAADYIYANGGGTLLLKPDSIAYDITTAIRPRKYVQIIGGGYGTLLKANASMDKAINIIENYDTTNGDQYIDISNLSIDGNYQNRGAAIVDEQGCNIMLKNSSRCLIEKVRSFNAVTNNIAFVQGTTDSTINKCITYDSADHNILLLGTAAGVECKRNIISNNISHGAGNNNVNGVNIELAKYATENTISGNICYNALEGGIHLFYRSNRNTIVGNQCISNRQNGISIVDESDHNEVGNNVIKSSVRGGVVHTTAFLTYGGYYNNIHHNKILNCGENGITGILTGDDINHNEIDSCGSTGTGNQKYGIYGNTPIGAKITHNRITASADRGIHIDNPQKCKIDDNDVLSNSGHGIFIDGTTVTDTSISNNTSDSNSGAQIVVLKNGARMKINGNTCKGSVSSNSGIDVRGITHSKIQGNNCSSNAGYGIRVRKDSNNVESTDNSIIGNDCTLNTLGGISEIDGSDYNIYTSNNCRGNTTANFSVVGANNQTGTNITA